MRLPSVAQFPTLPCSARITPRGWGASFATPEHYEQLRTFERWMALFRNRICPRAIYSIDEGYARPLSALRSGSMGTHLIPLAHKCREITFPPKPARTSYDAGSFLLNCEGIPLFTECRTFVLLHCHRATSAQLTFRNSRPSVQFLVFSQTDSPPLFWNCVVCPEPPRACRKGFAFI